MQDVEKISLENVDKDDLPREKGTKPVENSVDCGNCFGFVTLL